MVDVSHDEAIRRFPWTYSKVYDKEGNFIGYRVRLDFIVVSRPDDDYIFDMFHFTSLSDRLDNAQLAIECGLDVEFGHIYVYATPRRFLRLYNQIVQFESCVLHPST